MHTTLTWTTWLMAAMLALSACGGADDDTPTDAARLAASSSDAGSPYAAPPAPRVPDPAYPASAPVTITSPRPAPVAPALSPAHPTPVRPAPPALSPAAPPCTQLLPLYVITLAL